MKNSYQKGKDGEKQSDLYLKKFGFVRPAPDKRKNIAQEYKKVGLLINPKGFDLIKKEEIDNPLPTLYESKTAGADRRTLIGENWKGFGFTLTSAEEENAHILGEKYKFIWLDLKKQDHKILHLGDFLTEEKARIYYTKSVFIK